MKVVCEISGGADSALAALMAKDKYKNAEFFGIMINYGQKPWSNEFVRATDFCDKYDIELKTVKIDNLFSKGTVIGESKPADDGVADIYTPLRNVVILSCATSYAESINADVVVVGSKGLSYDPKAPYCFKDSTLPFYKLFEAMLSYTAYSPIKIDPILSEGRQIKMTKKEVFYALKDRGVDWDETWSCFNSTECGKCNNCLEKILIRDQWKKEN